MKKKKQQGNLLGTDPSPPPGNHRVLKVPIILLQSLPKSDGDDECDVTTLVSAMTGPQSFKRPEAAYPVVDTPTAATGHH